ncbi:MULTISPECIES: xanthine dehydrogenase family protein molybdopterin-binding subunit [unclassified Modestobacter]|uniref:xanthine dehydrogenase family protein molybdopterin-binding subunit n=1 Tax=unclassified Modestobacter TaxID=2643866 RepID=UPI0022AA353A|nr:MULTISPECIES: xanthine dehydrogenase family protein molybdopterin-binding subunit [unclassified Modestobacter]MCZ2824227.1 xanthine dehydrogenase family protein molybdopterin-binding subunit [Modestobacter sp. VKM Ac-2981]MCZ2854245.1 xanthine dehydrogenase family protein molybdopterin-binding subunit [Modestobacter sp. VKM Ac-2982]
MTTAVPPRLTGSPVRRQDGDVFVTGRAVYTADVRADGAAHVALVRSPHAHARIVAIDAAAARALPGVLAVVTGDEAAEHCEEIPHGLDAGHLGGHHAVVRPLAVGTALYAGEPVAAVVATNAADAALAAAAVEVTWERLPVVLDAEQALLPGAPLLYPDWGDNLIIERDVGPDDFTAAAADAAHVLEGELRTHRGTAAPMETRSYLADWDPAAGKMTVHATTQNPHVLRTVLAATLRLDEEAVHVIAPALGGSFGLKMYGNREDFIVPLLARMLGRPVRWVEERSATLLAGTREQVLRYRVAAAADGRLLALDVHAIADHGAAAPTHGWGMAHVGALATGLGYALPSCHVRYQVVATNKAPWVGTKPFGKDGATLLLERVVDRVAQVVGVHPAEVRRRNFVPPDSFPWLHTSGLELDSGDYATALDLTLKRLDHPAVLAEQRTARAAGRLLGIGLAFELMPESADIPGALVSAFDTSTVRMSPTGRVTVLTGVTSPGTGNETAIAQLVADELGVPMSSVQVVQGDTERCPYGFGNISSRSIITGGNAAVLAARDVAATLRATARAMLQVEPTEEVVLAGNAAALAADPSRVLPLAVVAGAVHTLSYRLALDVEPRLESTRTYRPGNVRQVPDALGRMQTYTTYPYAVHASVLEVDPETGSVTLLRHVVTHDCGTVVNPMFVDGQVTGGVAMGIGAALGEELVFDPDGVPLTTGFKTYLLPRAIDLPTVELEHLCTPAPGTPLGAKGVGESGFSGALAAVVNAVNDALAPHGAALESTPVSPPRILAALQAVGR